MIRWSYLSARPKTATELNVTGSRFAVFLLKTLTSSPTSVSLPFQGLTCSLTMSWHHFRRSSGSFAGISVGLPSRCPAAVCRPGLRVRWGRRRCGSG